MFQMKFEDFLNGTTENVFSHREETELIMAKKRIKDYFLKDILEHNLTLKEKQVYILKNKNNLTHKEISKMLGITKKTSRNILWRANKKIYRIAKEFENEYKID